MSLARPNFRTRFGHVGGWFAGISLWVLLRDLRLELAFNQWVAGSSPARLTTIQETIAVGKYASRFSFAHVRAGFV